MELRKVVRSDLTHVRVLEPNLRLVLSDKLHARAVLGQTEEAQQALFTAENQFADNENALSALSALASDLSLE